LLFRQIIATGCIDQIARKWPEGHLPGETDDSDWSKSREQLRQLKKKAYQCLATPEEPVFIHPSSYIYSG